MKIKTLFITLTVCFSSLLMSCGDGTPEPHHITFKNSSKSEIQIIKTLYTEFNPYISLKWEMKYQKMLNMKVEDLRFISFSRIKNIVLLYIQVTQDGFHSSFQKTKIVKSNVYINGNLGEKRTQKIW